MKTKMLFAWMILTTLGVSTATSQMQQAAAGMMQKDTKGSIPLGFGATVIDGQTYYLVNLAPEVAFGKLGIGLDLNLRVNSQTGKIRTEDFDETYDYFRMIRYIRWGLKDDPFYIRLGRLDYSRLGHGFIVYNYRNSASYDSRKFGMELDVNFEKFGFESMYSDLGGKGILGMRGYVKPLKFTSAGEIPVIGNLETGATFATDINENAHKLYDPLANTTTSGSLSIFGLDVGLPIVSIPMLKSSMYFDYAKIFTFGNGAAAGIDLHLSGLGIFALSAKYERRFMGDKFLPSYFNAMYERDRYIEGPTPTSFVSKASSLDTVKATQGYFGEVVLSILGTFNIVGGYQAPVGVDNQGVIHLELDAGNVIPVIQLSAGYDKKNVGSVFVVDNNSILYAVVGYKPLPYILVSTLYEWTFREHKDTNGKVDGYEPQKRIEPKISFVFNF